MNSYKFGPNTLGPVVCVKRDDGACIPFDMGNRDCARFVQEWHDGATVTNDDNSPASYTDVAAIAFGLTPPS